jgi:potassium-transporting ATPase potassium-binding subunit
MRCSGCNPSYHSTRKTWRASRLIWHSIPQSASANSPFYNLTLALGMFVGRILVIVPVLAIAGSLAAQPVIPRSAGTLPTDGALFVFFLIGVIVIVGGLTYLPPLALGPVVEHLQNS